jgi:hypothetical protein
LCAHHFPVCHGDGQNEEKNIGTKRRLHRDPSLKVRSDFRNCLAAGGSQHGEAYSRSGLILRHDASGGMKLKGKSLDRMVEIWLPIVSELVPEK